MPTKKQATEPTQQTELTLCVEDAMKRLEEIAGKLENGQASLDDSLSLYEDGIALVRYCANKLDTAEQRIRTLDLSTGPASSEQFH